MSGGEKNEKKCHLLFEWPQNSIGFMWHFKVGVGVGVGVGLEDISKLTLHHHQLLNS
jgi:hypothetical protein